MTKFMIFATKCFIFLNLDLRLKKFTLFQTVTGMISSDDDLNLNVNTA